MAIARDTSILIEFSVGLLLELFLSLMCIGGAREVCMSNSYLISFLFVSSNGPKESIYSCWLDQTLD